MIVPAGMDVLFAKAACPSVRSLCLGFGIGIEPISKWGPWMDLVSIYIIPIVATLALCRGFM